MLSFKTFLVCPAILAGFAFALFGDIPSGAPDRQTSAKPDNSLWLRYSYDADPVLIGYGDTIIVTNKSDTPLKVGFCETLNGPPSTVVVVAPGGKATSTPPVAVVDRIGLQNGDDIEAMCTIDCLASGALVQTSEGMIPVESLGSGMCLLSPGGSPIEVANVSVRSANQLVELSLGSEVLRTSLGHEFMLAGGEWEQASDLEVGMQLLVGSDEAETQQVAVVTAVREIQCETATPVYDVQLSGGRPFKVGNLGVVTRGSVRHPESVSAGR